VLTAILERRVDARPLALMRILVGLSSLVVGLEVAGVLAAATEEGVVTMPAFSWLPPVSTSLASGVFVVWSVAAVMLTIGYGARASAALVAACGLISLLLEQQTYSNHLLLAIALCLLMALSEPGARWSIEARRGSGQPDVAFWPVALMMLQVTTLYAFAALSKLNGSFLSGETMVAHSQSYFSYTLGDLPPEVLTLVAVSAVCAEGFLAFGLWHRSLRPLAFPLGLMLHGGIVLMLTPSLQLVPFALLALSCYALFLQPAPRTVIWAEGRRGDRRWVAIFRRLDWFGAHTFVAVPGAQAGRSIRVIMDGHRYEGYDAVRVILEACPASFLLAPALRLRALRWGRSPRGALSGDPLGQAN